MQPQLLSLILVVLLVTLSGVALFFTHPALALVQVLNLFALTSSVNTGRTQTIHHSYVGVVLL